MFKKFKKIKYNSGMTLIELLVVLAIFAIISGITMFDYASFKSNVSLNNLANDVSLSIRKAQSYAIGARGNSGSFSEGYKIHFSTDSKYSFSVATENGDTIETLNIKNGDYIFGFNNCNNSSSQTGDLDISFKRPNPDAKFSGVFGNNVTQVGIILSNQKGDRKKVICVTNNGQISIENYAEQN